MTSHPREANSITVDGERYRWLIHARTVSGEATNRSGFLVAIEHELGEGQILAVEFKTPRPDSWIGLESRVITPRDVAGLIRAGLARGWSPREPGPAFLLPGDEVV
jgi:hypothetical protein